MARTPAELQSLFITANVQQDVETLLSLDSEDVLAVFQNGVRRRGCVELRKLFEDFFAFINTTGSTATFEAVEPFPIENCGIVLFQLKLTITGPQPFVGNAVCVAQKCDDRWLIIIKYVPLPG